MISCKLSNRESKKIQPIISGALEAGSDSLLDALVFLQVLLMNMQATMVEKKPNLKTIMKNLRISMKNFVKCLELPPKENQCVNEFWNTLFHSYFELQEFIIYTSFR